MAGNIGSPTKLRFKLLGGVVGCLFVLSFSL